ncbi:TetR family transcriptional regulator [Janibacter cremeus]|uniref:AcrR family transcriptional regulator n=1 Tax=Janibacter cremeus TaxID=1285192 RepID=A0A852VR12_9MICO|nr:AcrR family transcriptional regulator [Janibacter cremeus]
MGTPASRRERILDAAETRFAGDGFAATGTTAIADGAAVPKGLVFYYFPRKVDILRALLAERLPSHPLCEPTEVARRGDPGASLVALAHALGLAQHESVVLRTIIWRESGTHPEVREHLKALRENVLELTERVLDAAIEHTIDPVMRRQASQTFVAVVMDEANTQRFAGAGPDVAGAARVISSALTSDPARA